MRPVVHRSVLSESAEMLVLAVVWFASAEMPVLTVVQSVFAVPVRFESERVGRFARYFVPGQADFAPVVPESALD